MHVAAVISGTLILLTLFGMGIILGAVQWSTTLFLPNDQITAYNMLAQRIDLLLAPYENLKNFVIMLDYAAVAVVIASAATLKRRTLHELPVLLAPFIVTADILLEGRYESLTQQALTQLPSWMDYGTLLDALQIQQRFNAAYGFWGSPEYHTLANILSWVTVGFLTVAAFTMKSVTASKTKVRKTESIPEIVPIEKAPTTKEQAPTPQKPSGTKFCRYCGAKIVKGSKFCEECGKSLVG
jgi:hypothetical protein